MTNKLEKESIHQFKYIGKRGVKESTVCFRKKMSAKKIKKGKP